MKAGDGETAVNRWLRLVPDLKGFTRRHALLLARLTLLVGLATMVWWWTGLGAEYAKPSEHVPPPFTDRDLYRLIITKVAAGQDYYATAFALHTQHGYPVIPWFTVRLPTFTWLTVALGENGAHRLAQALLLANIAAWIVAFHRERMHPAEVLFSAIALLAGTFLVFYDTMFTHEFWASLLLSLGFALYRPGREAGAVACVVAACLFREFAVVALATGLAVSVLERRPRAIGLWLVGIAVVAASYGWHAMQVIDTRAGAGLVSQGWNGRLGPAKAIYSYVANSIYRAPGMQWGGVLLVCTILGWLVGGARAWLIVPVTLGWLTAIAVFSRPENIYWSQLITVWFPVGIVLFPRFLLFAATGRGVQQGAAKPQPA